MENFKEDTMVKYFSKDVSLENRALQIWQILIGFAFERKITTYLEVADILGYKGSGTLDRQLGHILHYCKQNRLHPLTVLVVNSETGLPGPGFVTVGDLHREREKVFNTDWFDIIPPTPEEFALAWENKEL
jgi:alkylated DNA nucleotide flippase Atl1